MHRALRTTRLRTTWGLAAMGIACCAFFPANAATADWPLEVAGPEANVVMYEPQLETFKGDKATARAAVSVTDAGSTEPLFGAVWFSARTATDRETRMVTFTEIRVTDVRFPGAETGETAKLARFLEREMPKQELTLSLDHMLTMLDLAERERSVSENLRSDPPHILFETGPAVLVVLDGDPVLRKVEGTDLLRVVNTPYFMVLFPATSAYYLYGGGGGWAEASDPVGPWKPTESVPNAVVDLARSESSEAGAEAEGKERDPKGEMPRIIVATEPTELIITSGEPRFTPISGTDLLYVSNTGSHVLLEIPSQRYFVLLSGRWFVSASLGGPWAHVPSDQLPGGFARIPPGSPKADVLTFVAGTEEAREAVLDAHIPQTAAIRRHEATIEVAYDGEPRFEPIEGTSLSYAVNTSYAVLKLGDAYYCCHEGVWFEAASPHGPWTVCVSVPDEVRNIPPSCPLYPVKFVQVYDTTPEVVYVGYTPGYLGCYVYGGTIVYGTGWRYRPWVGAYYYPRPVTWGFHVNFNPWTGWGFGVAWGFPGGWFSFGTGGWIRPGGWWGPPRFLPPPPPPPGFRGPRPYVHPPNLYHRPPPAALHPVRPGRPVPGKPMPGKPQGPPPAVRPGAPSPGQVPPAKVSGEVRRPPPTRPPGDVYTDRAGNVYRRGPEGWQMRDRGRWTEPGRPRPGEGAGARYDRGRSDLNRQYHARQRGAQREQSYRSQLRGGGGGGLQGPGGGPARGPGGLHRGR